MENHHEDKINLKKEDFNFQVKLKNLNLKNSYLLKFSILSVFSFRCLLTNSVQFWKSKLKFFKISNKFNFSAFKTRPKIINFSAMIQD